MKKLLITLLVIDIVVTSVLIFRSYQSRQTEHELQVRIATAEHNAADDAMDHAVYDPSGFFSLIPDSAVWEPIKAVPYSSCYRHLIGTTTADFILCKAI